MKTLTVGVVGCGIGAAHHIPGLKAIQNVDVLWFCDKELGQARRLMKLWKRDVEVGDNVDALLSNYKPDVIHICTPQDSHAYLTVKALEAGCHVLLEKPMALSVAECREILEARDRTGCQLCLMHNHMFDPIIQKMHLLIRKGEFGKLIFGEVRHFYSVRKMEEEGSDSSCHWVHSLKSGIAGEFLPHSIYLLQSFFGPVRELQLIHHRVGRDNGSGLSRNSWALQTSFDDATGRMLIMDYMPYGHFCIDLYGTQAAAHINMMDLTYSIERIRSFLPLTLARMESTVEQSFSKLRQVATNSTNIVVGRLKRRLGHRNLIKAFYKSIRDGGVTPVSGEDGLTVIRTLEKFDDAMEQARTLRSQDEF